MAIRDRFAIALIAMTVAAMPLLATIAALGDTRRNVDVVALWVAAAVQLVLVLAWVFIPRLPKWIVAGWGLILIGAGIGVTIAAPLSIEPAGGSTFAWGLTGLVVFGILTILAAVIHSPTKSEL